MKSCIPALITAATLFAASPMFPQDGAPKDACSGLADAIEHSLKIIASEDAEGIGDNSAPRATLSELKMNNQLLLISVHLQLMRDNGCAKRKEPVRPGAYMLPALECKNAMLQMRLGREVPKLEGGALPLACDMSKWKSLSAEIAKPVVPQ